MSFPVSRVDLIRKAIQIVPSFRWAIAGTALLALAAIVVRWGLDLSTLFLVSGVVIVGGMAFVALQWVAKLKPEKTSLMAGFFAWSLLMLLVASLVLLLISAAFDRPWRIRTWIENQIISTKQMRLPSTSANPNTSKGSAITLIYVETSSSNIVYELGDPATTGPLVLAKTNSANSLLVLYHGKTNYIAGTANVKCYPSSNTWMLEW